MNTIDCVEFASPLGPLTVATWQHRVCALSFPDHWPRQRRRLQQRFGAVAFRSIENCAAVGALRDYFRGDLQALSAVDVDPGGTSFQQAVWGALRTISPGQTVSYGQLARSIGTPAACRAVGAANRSNPIAIIIPCHRVIGADGTLTGYGGGLERKRWLLAHEGCGAGETLWHSA